jgi:hypothetical protein
MPKIDNLKLVYAYRRLRTDHCTIASCSGFRASEALIKSSIVPGSATQGNQPLDPLRGMTLTDSLAR